jgi:hypothetical protein
VPVLTIPVVTTLRHYLRSRVGELVGHTDNLAVSVGLTPTEPDPEPASIVIGVLLGLARDWSGDLSVIRALVRSERAQPDPLRAL